MNENKPNLNKYLPIGTVVLLKNAKKRLMIIGYCSVDAEKKGKMYDYSGCLYPEGMVDSKQIALFDHNQIAKVFYLGLSDQEDKQFKVKLNKAAINFTNKVQ